MEVESPATGNASSSVSDGTSNQFQQAFVNFKSTLMKIKQPMRRPGNNVPPNPPCKDFDRSSQNGDSDGGLASLTENDDEIDFGSTRLRQVQSDVVGATRNEAVATNYVGGTGGVNQSAGYQRVYTLSSLNIFFHKFVVQSVSRLPLAGF